jgi:hypothetical protein
MVLYQKVKIGAELQPTIGAPRNSAAKAGELSVSPPPMAVVEAKSRSFCRLIMIDFLKITPTQNVLTFSQKRAYFFGICIFCILRIMIICVLYKRKMAVSGTKTAI